MDVFEINFGFLISKKRMKGLKTLARKGYGGISKKINNLIQSKLFVFKIIPDKTP